MSYGPTFPTERADRIRRRHERAYPAARAEAARATRRATEWRTG